MSARDLENGGVKINEEAAIDWPAAEQRASKTAAGRLGGGAPRMLPAKLEVDQGRRNPVISLDHGSGLAVSPHARQRPALAKLSHGRFQLA